MKQREHILQSAIVQYLRMNRIFCFSVPNGGLRNVVVAAKLKRSGALAGVSDLIILLKNRCIFVEVKTKIGRLSATQKTFQKNVEELGFEFQVWRNLDQAIEFVGEHKGS